MKKEFPEFIRETCYIRVIRDFRNFIAVSSGYLILKRGWAGGTQGSSRGKERGRHYIHEDCEELGAVVKRIFKSVSYDRSSPGIGRADLVQRAKDRSEQESEDVKIL